MNRLNDFTKRVATRQLDPRIWAVLIYADAHLQHELTLSQLAEVANTCAWHLCRLFKADIGLSPKHCVKIMRFQAAVELLSTTFLSVKEVMVAVGINDESHFVRDFKANIGYSPSEFRRQVYSSGPTPCSQLSLALANSRQRAGLDLAKQRDKLNRLL